MPDNLPAGHRAYARVNWSRWIVDCPSPYCRGAMQVVPGDDMVWCKDCGCMTTSIVWPADPETIEVILGARPDWTTRNWELGETLEQLLTENVIHGDPVPGLDMAGGPQEIMTTVDDRVVGGLLLDVLPSAEQRKAIRG